ncbi:MAG TPA: 50S ribosomal protein L13 [Dehalococcoidia bacterium]|nr:50S ribosomal protein L13 [Dehalococcoidia bacterium]
MIKTYSVKASDIERKWHIVDAEGQILGRMATQVARLLMGKHKPMFVRNMDVGDSVVVINADKVRFTGNKEKKKVYYRHTGYPGGLKTTNLETMMQKHPERVIEHAVKGMLPKNRLQARMMKRLRVYAGDNHPHIGQTGVVDTGSADSSEE